MSTIIRGNSQNITENAAMSAASDVLEMQQLCGEIADRSAATHHIKSRVAAIVRALQNKVSDNRAYEFLRAKALRIDSWEKDLARQERDRLRALADQRDAARFLGRLASTQSYLEASDPELYRADIAALGRALDAGRRAGSAVAVPPDAED